MRGFRVAGFGGLRVWALRPRDTCSSVLDAYRSNSLGTQGETDQSVWSLGSSRALGGSCLIMISKATSTPNQATSSCICTSPTEIKKLKEQPMKRQLARSSWAETDG